MDTPSRQPEVGTEGSAALDWSPPAQGLYRPQDVGITRTLLVQRACVARLQHSWPPCLRMLSFSERRT
eukprot:9496290-Pyramimonas_sp.AAC.1